MKEKIKQCLRQHLFLIEQEDWYDADKIAEDLAKVFSSNALLADEVCEKCKGLGWVPNGVFMGNRPCDCREK